VKTIAEYGVPAASASPRRDRVLASLFWMEWRRHRLGGSTAFLFLIPIMVVCATIDSAREGIFFWLVFSMAWGTGMGVGRVEWQEGEEEFQLVLPATRAQRYWVKFSTGALLLAGFYAIGAVTCFTDWFAFLGDVLKMKQFDDGDLPPYLGSGPAFVTFSLVAPLATYVECFALSMTVSRRGDGARVLRFVLFLIVGVALMIGGSRWLGESAGWLHAPVFIAYAVWRAGEGARRYATKDAVLDVQSTGPGERQKQLIVVGLLAAGLAAALLFGMLFWLKRG